MTENINIEAEKERVVVAAVNFREADKIAIADKRDIMKQREQYKELNNLRAAADKLIEAHHG